MLRINARTIRVALRNTKTGGVKLTKIIPAAFLALRTGTTGLRTPQAPVGGPHRRETLMEILLPTDRASLCSSPPLQGANVMMSITIKPAKSLAVPLAGAVARKPFAASTVDAVSIRGALADLIIHALQTNLFCWITNRWTSRQLFHAIIHFSYCWPRPSPPDDLCWHVVPSSCSGHQLGQSIPSELKSESVEFSPETPTFLASF